MLTASAPATDAGSVPNPRSSFSDAYRRVEQGDWWRKVTERDLPIATQLAGVNMKLDRVEVRELRFNMKPDRVGVRWHPNTDEWQYYLDGQARMTVFAAKGDAGGLLPLERQSRARGECGASALMCDSTAVNHQEVPHEH